MKNTGGTRGTGTRGTGIILIIFITLIILLWKNFEFYITYIPVSEICVKDKMLYKIEITDTGRNFDVLDDKIFNEINEIFEIQEKINFNSPFKGYQCNHYKTIENRKIKPYTLIFFPSNDVKWDSGMYFYNNERYYFPEPNSIIISDKELEWVGDPNINIVLGTKIS
jgi:hypothetical protein